MTKVHVESANRYAQLISSHRQEHAFHTLATVQSTCHVNRPDSSLCKYDPAHEEMKMSP